MKLPFGPPALGYTDVADIPLSVKRRAVAIHEAGHALVAILFDRKVTGAIIRANGLSGETQFEYQPDVLLDLNIRENRELAQRAIIELYAGQIAERRFWDGISSLYRPFIDSHRDDDERIREYKVGFDLSPDEDRRFTAFMIKETRRLVLSPPSWAAIEEIASVMTSAYRIEREQMDARRRRHTLID